MSSRSKSSKSALRGLAAALLSLSVTAGCASCPCGPGSAEARSAAPSGSSPEGALVEAQSANTASGAPGSSGAPSPLENATAPGAGADPRAALPEVVVETVGMHVGGGRNDDAEKAPFKAAIEPHFQEFRRCYVHTEQPGKGGTFGVDLFIDRDGGKPQVRQPRTGMSGEKFRSCVVSVFNRIDFERPRAGPTVISYSLRYSVGGH